MKVQKNPCGQCLFGKNYIVKNKARVREVIREALVKDTYFQCHKGTLKGENVCCNGFWNAYKDHFNLGRIVQRLGGPEFVGVKHQ